MAFESIFRKASAALLACACALAIGITFMVQAQAFAQPQALAMEESPVVASESPYAATPERIVIHGLRFQAQSDKIDKAAVPVLDYAIQVIKETPGSVVYVNVRAVQNSKQDSTGRDSELTDRRMRAVASYFEQEGISAKRLILLGSDGSADASNEDAGTAQNSKHIEVVQLDFVNEAD